MISFARHLVLTVVVLLLAAYSYFSLRQRVPALLETRQDIRQMQEENVDIARENEYKRERIRKLQGSPSAQDLEIRKKLKMLHQNETEFILPGK